MLETSRPDCEMLSRIDGLLGTGSLPSIIIINLQAAQVTEIVGLKACFSTMLFLLDLVSSLFVFGSPVSTVSIYIYIYTYNILFFLRSLRYLSLNLWPGTTCCELRSDFILESQLSACRSANQYTNERDFSPRKNIPAKFNRKLT